MALLKGGRVVEDVWQRVEGDAPLPAEGPICVDVDRWRAERSQLLQRDTPLGVRLASNEPPEEIACDLDRLSLVALEFPAFTDGRAYSHARVLRERYGFTGELRAVGDVELEHLHFMDRCGFDAFEVESDDPEEDWRIAQSDLSVWYQPTADGRPTALQRRHG